METLWFERNKIGEFEIINRAVLEEGFEGSRVILLLRVESDACRYDIEQSLLSAFTDDGWCGHEHDCCGCVRYNAWFADPVNTYADEQLWTVHVSASRNV